MIAKLQQQRTMMGHTLFISDLHLDETYLDSAAIFHRFILEQAPLADALYILGDFFEVWVGDDDRSAFANQIITSLKNLTSKGVPVYFLAGNRDFLIGKKFAKASCCQLLNDFEKINLYGEKVLLTHGDALCTHDKKHLRYRKLSRNPILQTIALRLPLSQRKKIGLRLREKSKLHTKQLTRGMLDVASTAVAAAFTKYKATTLIHGHTHQPTTKYFQENSQWHERIVLGSWERQGCALKWHATGKREMVFFK